ncbi:hypothetical protein BC629DRAFT_1480439 [Irpex lacteus]|nr:hypothetical protein BC629DRAFT_1480439 [Irpex lacteus]
MCTSTVPGGVVTAMMPARVENRHLRAAAIALYQRTAAGLVASYSEFLLTFAS